MTKTPFPSIPTALLLDTSFLRTLGGPGHHRHQLFTEYVKANGVELYLSERVQQEIEEQEGWISPDWLHKSQTESWVTAAQPVQEGVSVYDGPSAAVIMDRIQQRLSKIEQIQPDKEAVWAECGAEIIARPSSLTGNNQRLESSKCDTVSGRTPRNERPAFIHVHKQMEDQGDWRS